MGPEHCVVRWGGGERALCIEVRMGGGGSCSDVIGVGNNSVYKGYIYAVPKLGNICELGSNLVDRKVHE